MFSIQFLRCLQPSWSAPPESILSPVSLGVLFLFSAVGLASLFLNVEYPQSAFSLELLHWDTCESNHQNSNNYFRAHGNYDSFKREPGGICAAKMIRWELDSGADLSFSMADQEVNTWGQSVKDPNHFRPSGLDLKY
uniref:Serum amyloid A protein n=1 Tax=Vombatus ursinus TaxID=29139 RepID=A0A4X2JU72_VOMUR